MVSAQEYSAGVGTSGATAAGTRAYTRNCAGAGACGTTLARIRSRICALVRARTRARERARGGDRAPHPTKCAIKWPES